ncbi:Leucyl aminopeptidase [Plesiocystis pacifica SIR-1]|uniref:Leucyl aminopeptidase n=1 Tax=Plesiocystis pacifica SIR-1 TaxID=391625 RepID=A6GJU5_9BACT|nr:leucyl aminopeptidase family protein [Plesiocystis pacifica]EDM73861.1 Leucyl aminopeptidase [Plesiocystis pacifica SIR-1]
MRVTATERRPEEIAADAYVVLYRSPLRGHPRPRLSEHLRGDAGRLLARTPGAITWLESHGLSTPRVLLYCLGPELTPWDPELEYLGGHAGSFDRQGEALVRRRQLRNAGAAIERACSQLGIRHVALVGGPASALEPESPWAGCDPLLLIEGAILRAHGARAWEGEPSESSLRRVTLCLEPGDAKTERARLKTLLKVLDAANFARELGDLPSNIGTAQGIVERVRRKVTEQGLHLAVRTVAADEAAAMGMGLFCAVDAGAATRGCILRLEHRPRKRGAGKRRPALCLVGKGLTHDTGGYNLKTGPGVHQLTHDKCGATAVIGATLAIAALDLDIDLIALCPLTENAVDARAFKPGDVLTALDGTTVYIENTDAEGRLVLADALAWLTELDPTPDLVVDLATLTGAIHGALGEPFAGLYSNENRARDLLLGAGQATGELLWSMPIHEIHERDLGHHKADMRNVGVSAGSPSAAAAFLRHFVDYPWAHIDLAGKAYAEYPRECFGSGATGFGARLLVELAQRMVHGAELP